jgi:hypothetical protein
MDLFSNFAGPLLDAFWIAFKAIATAATYSLAITLAGFAVGDTVLKWERAALTRAGPAVDWATAFALGLGAYGAAWTLLGTFGWFRIQFVLPMLALGAIVGSWRLAVSVFSDGRRGTGNAALPRPMCGEWLVCSLLAALILILVFAALRPPLGDGIVFYLAWPKVIAASGTVAPLPQYEHFSSIWMTSEAHFSALFLIGGESAAKVFVPFSLIAAMRAGSLLAVECGCGRVGSIIAAPAIATSTAITNVAVDGKADLIAVAPALAATLRTLRLGPGLRVAPAVLTGLLLGIAVSAKLTYSSPSARRSSPLRLQGFSLSDARRRSTPALWSAGSSQSAREGR